MTVAVNGMYAVRLPSDREAPRLGRFPSSGSACFSVAAPSPMSARTFAEAGAISRGEAAEMRKTAAQRNLGYRARARIQKLVARALQAEVTQYGKRTFAAKSAKTGSNCPHTDAGVVGETSQRDSLPNIFSHERLGPSNIIGHHCRSREAICMTDRRVVQKKMMDQQAGDRDSQNSRRVMARGRLHDQILQQSDQGRPVEVAHVEMPIEVEAPRRRPPRQRF